MLRGALAATFCTILGAFAPVWAFSKMFSSVQKATLGTSCLQMLRGALAGRFCTSLGAFQGLSKRFSSGFRKQR